MQPAISIAGATKSYGEKLVLHGVDLTINSGEIFAILGPNGAGKTTLVEILEGYRDRDGGDVTVLGIDPADAGSEWRNRIGIVLQNASDAGDLTVFEVVDNFTHYYSNSKSADDVISQVGLSTKRDSKVSTLSGGQRRRLDVALGIIGTPEILFLDEPTTGFDPEARREFWELIRKLRSEGTTILLTTHYLDEAEALADRVAVLAAGRVVEVSTPASLGGREKKGVHISWREGDELREVETQTPTAFIQELALRFNGEIPGLQVKRPTLEEIYLEMIGVSE